MSDHRARYKNTGLDSKELRRRREEGSIQLRKAKRDEFLSKKRTFAVSEPRDEHNNISGEADMLPVDSSPTCDSLTRDMIEGIMQRTDLALISENAQKVRRLLSKEPQPPFDEVIASGLIPRLVELLDLHQDTMIQFEVAWILTNICSGTTEQTHAVINCGALPKLVKLMRSPDLRVCEQAVWALGNIIGDGPESRDLVISYNMIPEFLALISPNLDIGFLRNATWVLVNLCRNKEPPTDIEVIKQILPTLSFLIDSEDQNILIDTAWAISYITELGEAYIQLIIDSGLVKKITQLLSHGEYKIGTATIRALGCIATGSEEQTQSVIEAGAIGQVRKALEGHNQILAKDALWLISNVVAGSQQQLQSVIDENLVPFIINYLSCGDYHQQKEASWAVYNFCLVGSEAQLRLMIDNNLIPGMCDLLTMTDTTLVRNILESLRYLLQKTDNEHDHTVRDQIEECGGLDKIEALQDSMNNDVYNYAYNIIETYFRDDANNGDDNDA